MQGHFYSRLVLCCGRSWKEILPAPCSLVAYLSPVSASCVGSACSLPSSSYTVPPSLLQAFLVAQFTVLALPVPRPAATGTGAQSPPVPQFARGFGPCCPSLQAPLDALALAAALAVAAVPVVGVGASLVAALPFMARVVSASATVAAVVTALLAAVVGTLVAYTAGSCIPVRRRVESSHAQLPRAEFDARRGAVSREGISGPCLCTKCASPPPLGDQTFPPAVANSWYGLAFSEDVVVGAPPLHVRAIGQSFALWRTTEGRYGGTLPPPLPPPLRSDRDCLLPCGPTRTTSSPAVRHGLPPPLRRRRLVVQAAFCPHLGANLAAGGRIVDNCIECP